MTIYFIECHRVTPQGMGRGGKKAEKRTERKSMEGDGQGKGMKCQWQAVEKT